ncbi:AAA family ATPase [Ammonicoccus fulvus]|uniref:Nuclease SbcCD subunit C n=1 Tax=Ammonicoccus fulvus TaxID=3138240 RepID=A0ABZ3FRX2_9ACTN
MSSGPRWPAVSRLIASWPGKRSRVGCPTAPHGPWSRESFSSGSRFWRGVQVSGFRGIGPESFIGFRPMPGLTIVSGRNGSGKSSFSEAMEIALTGAAHRWNKPNSQFEPEHRNLHVGEPCRVRLDLVHQGEASSRIEVEWKPDAPRDAFRRTLEREDQLPEEGIASLGWDEALVTYRPLLSYEELGNLLAGRQIDIAQAVQKALGLGEITAAKTLINDRLKTAGQPRDREKTARGAARAALEQAVTDVVDDARITEALGAFATKSLRKNVDLTRARELATGGGSDTSVKSLEAIVELEVPTEEAVRAAADELRSADAAVAELAGALTHLEQAQRQLLTQALDLHEHAGDQACPVCGEGTLDAAWRARVQATLDASGEAARLRDQALQRQRSARSRVRALVGSLPRTVIEHSFDLTSQPAAVAAWARWASLPTEPATWADHVEKGYADLAAATSAWQAEAAQVAQDRRDVWAPLAVMLSEWIGAYEAYAEGLAAEERLKSAKKVMDELEKAAQSERLAPITERAQHIWNLLKQESNVYVADIALSPRKLEISATVDGEPVGALRVMSQGELHALALALFLPRVTLEASPFQFVVLDDPVQAMDPAKVEGLLAVLLEIAETHQVVVLSHDDRLADAARRHGTGGAQINLLEVQRGENSVVHVVPVLDPVRRHINDAVSLYKDPNIPPNLKTQLVPGVLRMALESAALTRYFTRQLRAGRTIPELEDAWQDARTTQQKVALALHPQPIELWKNEWVHREALRVPGPRPTPAQRSTNSTVTSVPCSRVPRICGTTHDNHACHR